MLSGAYVRASMLFADGVEAVAGERGFDGLNHPPAATLRADGVDVAFLYAGTPASTTGKDFTAAQYRDYKSGGIKCVFVFEHTTTDWHGLSAAGRANAAALLADLRAKGTDGTDPVAVSIDQHIDATNLGAVVSYVTGFARAIVAAGYQGPVGVYGFAEVLNAVHAAGVVAWYWCAGARSTVPAFTNVWQDNSQTILLGGSKDDVDWILVPLPEDDMATDFDSSDGAGKSYGWDVAHVREVGDHPDHGFIGLRTAIDALGKQITGALSKQEADLLAAFAAGQQHVDVELTDEQAAALSGPILTQLAALPGAVRQAIGQALVAPVAGA